MNLSLAQALRVQTSPCIAFVGAGGKTTALFQLARQLPEPVIVTATTHLGAWQTQLADRHIITQTPGLIEEIEHGLKGITLVTGEIHADRTEPINDSLLDWLHAFCHDHSIPLLIEADGSQGKPLKAWADHEPPVPPFVELVVQVAGLMGLGRLLSDEHVHRAELFSRLGGLNQGEPITAEALVQVLGHRQGGLKNIPQQSRRVVLLNQADTGALQSSAQRLSQSLLSFYHSVVVARLEQHEIFAVHEPVAGIVLAAGGSTRFGKPKQLLEWKGRPFVRAVAQTALEAGLSPVIVVGGAHVQQVASALEDLEVIVIDNPEWELGQGSSITAGVKGLSASKMGSGIVGSAIFLLADQPQVTPSVLRALIEKHAEGLYPIVAPMVLDRRANPVLFDRVAFADLMALEGDVGGRAIFHKHRVEYLPWHDDRLLLDVDTPEMYQRLLADDTL
ncbi:MAG TPA: selenium cofactor biosynthesis protein YqeC [Anaerolineales bacterium]|nr:selenium cofactor biosynthesis protein YqeC [Anaerolineales bacterium]